MMHLQPKDFQGAPADVDASATTLMRWFCVLVAPSGYRRRKADGEEALDEYDVERRLKAAGFDAFVPVAVRVLPPKGPRRKTLERKLPLFRGYAFVRLASPVSRADWSAVCCVDGVVRILGTISGPTPVPVGLVEALRDAGDIREQSPDMPTRFRKRMLARITNGPFANFVGMVARAESDKRIHILLRMMGGGEMPVVVPTSVLEAVEPPEDKGKST